MGRIPKDYNGFGSNIRYAMKTGKLDEGHVIFSGKSVDTEKFREYIMALVARVQPLTVRGVAYRVLSEGYFPGLTMNGRADGLKGEGVYFKVQRAILELRDSGRMP